MSQFSAEQKDLLQIAQSNFPIAHDPYEELGSRIGLSGDEAYANMCALRDDGYVRRLGPVFDSYRLGYVSTLCAVAVPDEQIDCAAAFINQYINVTHNYLRDNKYNLWFTVIAHGDGELKDIVQAIESNVNSKVLQLPAVRLFKIKVDFNIKGKPRVAGEQKTVVPRQVEATNISSVDKAIIRAAQSHSFAARHPYLEVAAEASKDLGEEISEQRVIEILSNWKASRTIRRFGLTLKHHKVGFRFNVMGVWDVQDADVEAAGKIMAAQDEVSHCYERPRVADWQSNLYTMVHGQSREQCDLALTSIRSALDGAGIAVKEPQKLYTLRELKKQSMQYFCEEGVR